MDLPFFFGELALRSLLLLGAVFAALRQMRRASAAERHLVLVLTVMLLLVLPESMLFGPKIAWQIAIPRSLERPPAREIPATASVVEASSADDVIPIANAEPVSTYTLSLLTLSNSLAVAWGGGALLQVVILAAATRTWRHARRSASPAGVPSDVLERARAFAGRQTLPPILVSEAIDVPVLLGWLRPAILLPQAALGAPSDRLVMMICHELAHLRRNDARLLPLLALVRVVYWWQPLAWMALRRLRREREAACDDLVLSGPFRASDYAELIVDAARRLQATRPLPAGAFAMAMNSPVHERLAAILDSSLRRGAPSRGILLVAIFVAALTGFVLAGTQIEASEDETVATAKPSPGQPPRQVLLEFKLMSVEEKVYQANKAKFDELNQRGDAASLASLIQFANATPGIDLLSAPTVTTQDGLKAEVDIVREFPYPAAGFKDKEPAPPFTAQTLGKPPTPPEFKEEDIGLQVEATPHLTADQRAVDLGLDCQIITFEGWDRSQPGVRRPIFMHNNIKTNCLLGSNNSYGHVFSEPARGDFSPKVDGAGVLVPPAPGAPLKRGILIARARILPPEQPIIIPNNEMIRTALKFFQISEKSYAAQPAAIDEALLQGDMTYLSKIADFDLLSEPVSLSSPGEQATLEATRVIVAPFASMREDGTTVVSDHGRRWSGVRVLEKASPSKTGINLILHPEVSQLAGSIKTDSGQVLPVFYTRQTTIDADLPDGSTHGFWVGRNVPDLTKSVGGKPGFSIVSDVAPVRVGMMITADLYTQDGQLLRHPLPRHAGLIDKFNTIAIRQFTAHQQDVADVLTALTIECKNADPNHQGINFVLNLSRPFPTVDLDVENASPREIVDAIAKQTGLAYSIDDYAVYLRPPSTEQALSVRSYLPPAGMLAQMRESITKQAQDPRSRTEGVTDVKEALSTLGFKFPPGASAFLLANSSKLVVRNTPEQLDSIATYIENHPQ